MSHQLQHSLSRDQKLSSPPPERTARRSLTQERTATNKHCTALSLPRHKHSHTTRESLKQPRTKRKTTPNGGAPEPDATNPNYLFSPALSSSASEGVPSNNPSNMEPSTRRWERTGFNTKLTEDHLKSSLFASGLTLDLYIKVMPPPDQWNQRMIRRGLPRPQGDNLSRLLRKLVDLRT